MNEDETNLLKERIRKLERLVELMCFPGCSHEGETSAQHYEAMALWRDLGLDSESRGDVL